MIKNILQKVNQYSKAVLAAAMQSSGTAMLYLCTSTLLAAILTGAWLTYAWDIDKEKWYHAMAVLRGLEEDEIRQAERERIAELSYEAVREERARRFRENEFQRDVRQQSASFSLPPADPPSLPPPPPSDAERISAYEQRVRADTARSQAAGLADQTDLIENMEPVKAKEVIRRLWKEDPNRVLQMFSAMEDRRRKDILYAMEETNDEELKDLCEILQRIGDGAPTTSIIENAAREPQG